VGSRRIQVGKGFGDLARESRVQVHLPLGPHLAEAGLLMLPAPSSQGPLNHPAPRTAAGPLRGPAVSFEG
jgi:hypothetical protein